MSWLKLSKTSSFTPPYLHSVSNHQCHRVCHSQARWNMENNIWHCTFCQDSSTCARCYISHLPPWHAIWTKSSNCWAQLLFICNAPVCWVRLLLCWQPVVCTLYWHLLFIVYLLLLQLYSQRTKILPHIIFHCGLNECLGIHYVSQHFFCCWSVSKSSAILKQIQLQIHLLDCFWSYN